MVNKGERQQQKLRLSRKIEERQIAAAYGDFNNIIFSKIIFKLKMDLNQSFLEKLISNYNLLCSKKKLGITLSYSDSKIKIILDICKIAHLTKMV